MVVVRLDRHDILEAVPAARSMEYIFIEHRDTVAIYMSLKSLFI